MPVPHRIQTCVGYSPRKMTKTSTTHIRMVVQLQQCMHPGAALVLPTAIANPIDTLETIQAQ